ncbi:MAG: tRNA-dihydrouridine synthase family protein [Clostridia bacterium]|nr:tRNA-dihydrouridine synthase family protein [Clostridia bacterium]
MLENVHIQFAPLEGITDAVYREVHHRMFGGVSEYMIPFVSPTQDRMLPAREMRAIAPEYNEGVPVVPQILAKDATLFVWLAERLQDMGYTKVNLNLGCPSGTVTAKGKGAGMLRDPDTLARFLDAIFTASPLPISLKTRVGYESLEEWPRLLEILARYPAAEIIIHPRLRSEFYKGEVHRELFARAAQYLKVPVIYNGDVFTKKDAAAVLEHTASCRTLMVGRGLAANPAFARELSGGKPLTAPEIRTFHDELYARYAQMYSERIVLGKMREVTKYLLCAYDPAPKLCKAMLKAQTGRIYSSAIDQLFALPLRNEPGFVPFTASQTWS